MAIINNPTPVPITTPAVTVGPLTGAPAPVVPGAATGTIVPTIAPISIDTSPVPVVPGAGTGVLPNAVATVSTASIANVAATTTPITANTATGNNVVVVTPTKPGGTVGSLQYNNSGTFGGVTGWDVVQGGIRAQSNLTFITPGSSPGSERYITFLTPGLSQIMSWGTYANSILGEGPAFQWYGPTGYSSLFYTNLRAGNIVFPNGGEDWTDSKPTNGMMIGSDLKFYNSKSANAAQGHVGVYYSDGTYQYTTVKASNQGAQISNSVVGLNFTGNGVTATNSAGNITITIPGGGSGSSTIAVQEEGTNVVATANTINFVGSGVTASNVGGVATITIPGGAASTIAIQEEGSNVVAAANTINFVGTGVTASNVSGVATVTVNTTNINTVYDAGSATTVTLNYNNGQWQNYTPSGGTLDITVSNIPTGGEMTIFLQTGDTGSAITWHGPTVFFWEGGDDQPSTTSGIRDVITIKNNGNYYFAKFSKGYIT